MRRLLLTIVLILLAIHGGLVASAAPAGTPHRVGVFDSVNVDKPEAIQRLKEINSAIPGAEVVNYSWQWGATADRQAYTAEAAKLGMQVDPAVFDYTLDPLNSSNKGLQFVREAKGWKGIGRYFIFDETLSALKGDERTNIETLDHDTLAKYLPTMRAYNAAIHEIDPSHHTWGVVECYPDNPADMAHLISQLVEPDASGVSAVDEVGCDTYTADNGGDVSKVGMAAQSLEMVKQAITSAPFVIQVNDLGNGAPSQDYVCGAMKAVADNYRSAQLWVYDPLNFTNHPAGLDDQDQSQLGVIHSCLVQNSYVAAG